MFAPVGEIGTFASDRPNLNVEVAEDPGAMSQVEARNWLEQRAFRLMAVHQHFEILQSVPTTLAGQPAWIMKVTLTSLIDGSEGTNMQIMTGINGRTYLVSYNSPAELFDQYLPAVQNMINSFKVE